MEEDTKISKKKRKGGGVRKKRKSGKSRRSKVKYPAFDRRYNLLIRQDYMEAVNYVDGVYDAKGNQVMPPLNENEREWLHKFEEEVVSTKFKKDGSDHYQTDEERKQIYAENNARNRCLYNKSKRVGKLIKFDITEYDKFVSEALKDIDPEDLIIQELQSSREVSDEGDDS